MKRMHKTRASWRTPPKPILEERLLLTSLFCISITNYLVFLVWSEVSRYFEIIEVVGIFSYYYYHCAINIFSHLVVVFGHALMVLDDNTLVVIGGEIIRSEEDLYQ